tara:strand:- start:11 stop:388 length:378 start_codon:yes stop_codon:yes gene_type:complete
MPYKRDDNTSNCISLSNGSITKKTDSECDRQRLEDIYPSVTMMKRANAGIFEDGDSTKLSQTDIDAIVDEVMSIILSKASVTSEEAPILESNKPQKCWRFMDCFARTLEIVSAVENARSGKLTKD